MNKEDLPDVVGLKALSSLQVESLHTQNCVVVYARFSMSLFEWRNPSISPAESPTLLLTSAGTK